ncbi:MAG: helix-hairpin-helix domain-containing protein [Terriglobales bacterium]
MENRDIARLLRETADLMEVAGEDPFRIRGYRRAAETIAGAEPAAALAADPAKLLALPGIGPKLAEAIQQIAATGALPLHDELLHRYQPGMLQLLNVQGLGPKTIALIWERHGVATVDAVEALARSGQLRGLPRWSEKKEAQILQAIATYRALAGRFLRSTAARAAAAVQAELRAAYPHWRLEVAGSYRRGQETVGGLDLVVSTPPGAEPQAVATAIELSGVAGVAERRSDFAAMEWAGGGAAGIPLPLRLWAVSADAFAARWLQITGPARHWNELQSRAAARGLDLNDSGLSHQGAPNPAGEEERIYAALDLPWIPPELRDRDGIVAAAADRSLPQLISTGDLRADLHMHTVETDGRATIQEMAAAALARGYQAIAITDHSQALAMARGLNEERALAHIRRIRAADREFAGRLRIFAGIEVDILGDGHLDLADAVLAEMDIVIASVHSRFDQSAEETTARLLRAIGHGQVRILGHPTGRRLLRRPPYAMDFDRVAAACSQAGVVMEINASPERLDLNAELARRAAELGARLAINTDAHHPDHLDFISHGIATARRAGIGADRVLNTLGPEELLAALRPKPPRQ